MNSHAIDDESFIKLMQDMATHIIYAAGQINEIKCEHSLKIIQLIRKLDIFRNYSDRFVNYISDIEKTRKVTNIDIVAFKPEYLKYPDILRRQIGYFLNFVKSLMNFQEPL